MNKFRRFGRLLAATTATTVVLSGTAVAGAQETVVDISVTNITDFHGHLEYSEENSEMGAARLSSLMDYVSDDNDAVIKTTSGDNVGGSAFVSSATDDQYTLEALNEMGIEASAVGNHEFDQGFNDLQDRIIPNSDYPILGANVVDAETGDPLLEASTVVEKEGVSVGFVGNVTQNTANKVSPSAVEGIEFTDPVVATNAEATRLKEEEGVDVVVALSHEDAEGLAPQYNNDVDALFGGDTHVQSQGEVPREGAQPLVWAQGLEYGKILNELEFEYNTSTDKLVNIAITQHEFAAGASVDPDPVVAETVSAAAAQADEIGDEVITSTGNTFYRGSNPGAESGSNRGVESTANNMIADANRWAMNDFLGGEQIDIGLMNAGGVRADLPAGEVTYADAATVQPFGNMLSYATLSGQAILDALENQWQPGNERPRLSLGVSNNVDYIYDVTQPHGERIQHLTINGEPLDPAADYTVATGSFLFEGGDGYIDPAEVRNLTDVGYLDVTAFTDYLAAEGNPDLREGQAEISVTGLDNLTAGETATLDLSSLNYSTEGEPMASEVTVTIGEESVTAPIDNTVTEADTGRGENGRATVEIALPATAGEHTLNVTTDAGTDISMPITVGDAPLIAIGENGNWFIEGEDSNVRATAQEISIGENGNWLVDGEDTDVQAEASQPTIGENGNWLIDGEDTGVRAAAPEVAIGENGNWLIDGEDTGVRAEAEENVDVSLSSGGSSAGFLGGAIAAVVGIVAAVGGALAAFFPGQLNTAVSQLRSFLNF